MKEVIEQIVRLIIDGNDTKAEVVGEVMRCKDCKYYKKLKDVDGLKFCTCVIGAEFAREFDDYCSRGERKETKNE